MSVATSLPSWTSVLNDSSMISTTDACSILGIPFKNHGRFFQKRDISGKKIGRKRFYLFRDLKSIIENESDFKVESASNRFSWKIKDINKGVTREVKGSDLLSIISKNLSFIKLDITIKNIGSPTNYSVIDNNTGFVYEIRRGR